MPGKVKYIACLLGLFLFTVIILPGCAQDNSSSFKLTLKISSAKPGDTLYFSYTKINNGEPELVNDMAIYQAESITFTGSLAEPVEATVSRYITEKVDTAEQMKYVEMAQVPEESQEELISYFLNPRKRDEYTFFLLPGDTKITASKKLSFAKAEGPEALAAYIKLKADFEKLNRELSYELFMRSADDTVMDKKAISEMGKTYGKIQRIARDSVYLKFAKENPASPVSLYALRNALPVLVDSADKYITVFHTLSPAIQQWQSAKRLLAMLEAAKKTELGQVVEDFQQPDSLGKMTALSSFRGKYVLIELWASWCVPCRKKNPGLITIYEKYSPKNFTILGIALEEPGDRVKWLNAIKKDKLTWPQLSDFKGWDNAVARQFGVRAIPFNLLIDSKGTIIAKNIYEEELDTLLSGVLK